MILSIKNLFFTDFRLISPIISIFIKLTGSFAQRYSGESASVISFPLLPPNSLSSRFSIKKRNGLPSQARSADWSKPWERVRGNAVPPAQGADKIFYLVIFANCALCLLANARGFMPARAPASGLPPRLPAYA